MTSFIYIDKKDGELIVSIDDGINDETILDLAKSSRNSQDRGKLLGVSSNDFNDLVLFDASSGGTSSGTGGLSEAQIHDLLKDSKSTSTQISGRSTVNSRRFPSDLANHTDPIEVPIPKRYTNTWEDMAKSIDWPVVPFEQLYENEGTHVDSTDLDADENSIKLAEGMYLVDMHFENIWINDIAPGAEWLNQTNSAHSNQRLNCQFVVERYKDKGTGALCRITLSDADDDNNSSLPDNGRSGWIYVRLTGDSKGPDGNEKEIKVQYDSSVTNGGFKIYVDGSGNIIIGLNGTINSTTQDSLIEALNGQLALSDGNLSDVYVEAFSAGPVSVETNNSKTEPKWSSSSNTKTFPFKLGTNWVEESKSSSSYVRQTLFARQTKISGDSNSSGSPGSDDKNDGSGSKDYDGMDSQVEAHAFSLLSVPSGGGKFRIRLKRGNAFKPSFGTGGTDLSGNSTQITYDAMGFGSGISGRHGPGTTPWGYFCDIPDISFFPVGGSGGGGSDSSQLIGQDSIPLEDPSSHSTSDLEDQIDHLNQVTKDLRIDENVSWSLNDDADKAGIAIVPV